MLPQSPAASPGSGCLRRHHDKAQILQHRRGPESRCGELQRRYGDVWDIVANLGLAQLGSPGASVSRMPKGSFRSNPLAKERPVSALCSRWLTARRTAEDAPYVWTGCSSQMRWCCRKSLICIRPGDRLAGRGLDGSTHAPLISLPARLPGSRLGHQIRDASINPFHATPQSRTRFRWRPRSPRPQAGYRTLSRCAGRSRQFARACSPTRRRVCSCAIAATPF